MNWSLGWSLSGVVLVWQTPLDTAFGAPTGEQWVAIAVAALGVVGLAVTDDAIERLTRKVRRVAAGSEADFDVDRDDELGDLYDAVGDLASTIEARDAEGVQSSEYRKRLYDITVDPDLDDATRIERLLELGRERLDAEAGMITTIDVETGRYVVETSTDSDFAESGTETGLDETFCRKTITQDEVLGIHDALEEGYEDDPGYRRWGIGAYLGGKLVVDGELYGTLCFVDQSPRDRPYTESEKAFIDLMSRWISNALERREYGERLRLADRAMEAAPIGVTITDPTREDNPIVQVNPTFEAITGYDQDEASGRNCRFLQGPESDSAAVAELRRAVEEREPATVELRNYRKDGSPFWNRVSIAPVTDEFGDLRTFVGFQEDVTERMEHQRELERYKGYMEDLLDSVDDVFYVIDADGNLQRWNAALCEVTGYADDALSSMHAREFFPTDQQPAIEAAIAEVLETGSTRIEAHFLTNDGERIPYEFIAVALEDPDGNKVVTGIGRDVSERNRYEAELERTTHMLQQAGRLAGVGGFVIDVGPDGGLESTWSEQIYRLFDLPTDADIDIERAIGFLDPEDQPEVWEKLDRTVIEGEGTSAEVRLESATGNQRWVRAIAEPVIEDGRVVAVHGSVQDVTEAMERQAELERSRDLLQQAGRMADFGGWELDATTSPREVYWSEQLYELHDVPPGTSVTLETALDYYHPDDRAKIREHVERALETGRGYEIEIRALAGGGEIRWLRAQGEALREDGEVTRLRGAIQDITAQKEREHALESLHESTRGLLDAETVTEATDVVVDAAENTLDTSAVGIFIYDEEENRLRPTALSSGFDGFLTDEPAPVGPDDESPLWRAFVTDEGTVVEGDTSLAPFLDATEHSLVMPIGAHGVFLAVERGGTFDEDTRRLAETLVASAEAGFDRIRSDERLRERDRELEARNERLRRQIRVTETIRAVDRTLIGATNRDGLEAAVCEQLIEGDTVEFAWIGGFDAAGERLVPRSWAGEAKGYLDEAAFDQGASSPEPAAVAAESGTPVLVRNVGENVREESWRRQALAANFQSILAVPLSFDEYRYGVLAVYATEPRAFGDLEETVFTELGESIANAIASVSTRQALHTDRFVSLTLRLTGGTDPLVGIADAIDGTVAYEGLATHSGEEARLFIRTTGVDAGSVADVLADRHGVLDYRLVSEGEDGDRFEVTLRNGSVVTTLLRHGGHPRSVTADPSGLDVVVELPVTADVRGFVSMLDEEFDVELRRRREEDRMLETHQGVVEAILADLTDRQREVLRTAHLAGFFNWPRDTTGEELAEMLDVSQPTVNRHLRLAERHVMAALFDGEQGVR